MEKTKKEELNRSIVGFCNVFIDWENNKDFPEDKFNDILKDLAVLEDYSDKLPETYLDEIINLLITFTNDIRMIVASNNIAQIERVIDRIKQDMFKYIEFVENNTTMKEKPERYYLNKRQLLKQECKIEKLNRKISQMSSNFNANINKAIKEANDTKDSINEHAKKAKKEITDSENLIKELLLVSNQATLSRYFQERRKGLGVSLMVWMLVGCLSIAILVSINIDFYRSFKDTISQTAVLNQLLVRSLLRLPLYIVLYFSIRQYIKDKKLREIYTHKAVVSKTLPILEKKIENKEVLEKIILETTKVVVSPTDSKPEASDTETLKAALDILIKTNKPST